MTREINIDQFGSFHVSDDPDGVIANALLIATNNVNAPGVAAKLAPDGTGVHVETFGSIHRAWSRDELPPPFDEDASLAVETGEVWVLFKEPDKRRGIPGLYVLMSGGELRELVDRALRLRKSIRSQ